jgi:purine nucleosidase
MAPISVLLDTDVGTDVDDALAIALVLASPEIDLCAVTTVSGDVRLRAHCQKALVPGRTARRAGGHGRA